ncbi:MAG: hypothetical protein RLZZ470_1757 [Pseudomonadota bacterium]|jgi:hypothetical protein
MGWLATTAMAQDFVPHVYLGRFACEFKQTVALRVDPQRPGSYVLNFKKRVLRMTPVPTPSGAVRLEDEQAGVIWVQLNSKSMLMDQQRGVRLVDECQHPDQAAMAKAMASQPTTPLLDADEPQR